jgi:hypothetical protein
MTVKRACTWLAMGLCVLLFAGRAGFAKVSAEEAEKLKTELTPMGAERAGNKDGTIPEWTGGTKQKPRVKGEKRTNGFENEKPLFSITSKNVDQYADKLAQGQVALLKKYPTYRIDVYPTHRTASLPEHMYEAIYKNATRAVAEDGGITLTQAAGGLAFPIPKTGNEALWNHIARCEGEAFFEVNDDITISPAGKKIVVAAKEAMTEFPICYKGMTPEKLEKEYSNQYWNGFYLNLGPPDVAGQMNTGGQLADYVRKGSNGRSWQYLVGQRRVRQAPSIAYDTPNPVNSGAMLVDEVWGVSGSQDRFDVKILGKKEMYVPYNCEKAFYEAPKNLLMDHHLNPDVVRYELHRVWVVDMTLKAGKRNIVPHRRQYLDEDTWFVLQNDGWDGQGQLWHTGYSLPYMMAEIPAMQLGMFGQYDLLKKAYFISGVTLPNGKHKEPVPRRPASTYSPEEMARRGVR